MRALDAQARSTGACADRVRTNCQAIWLAGAVPHKISDYVDATPLRVAKRVLAMRSTAIGASIVAVLGGGTAGPSSSSAVRAASSRIEGSRGAVLGSVVADEVEEPASLLSESPRHCSCVWCVSPRCFRRLPERAESVNTHPPDLRRMA